MIYLSSFHFPSAEKEYDFTFALKDKCYDTIYPFQILSKHNLRELNFEPVTILYGGNGSGKSTALNVIAEKLRLNRDTPYNRSCFYERYTDWCDYETENPIPGHSRIVTSDDVFDFMLNLRKINEGIDVKREDMFDEYQNLKHRKFRLNSLEDYEELKKITEARRLTRSKYVRANVQDNLREHSNGESALMYFQEKLKDNGLYLLDEPENSLSPAKQLELAKFLTECARFYGCQLIMATHSPFILAMKGARIYNLDAYPVDICRWTELESVKTYYDFFKEHEKELSEI